MKSATSKINSEILCKARSIVSKKFTHPKSGCGEDAAGLKRLHNGDVSLNAHRHHDEHRGHVAERLDVQIHLAHEKSQRPTEKAPVIESLCPTEPT